MRGRYEWNIGEVGAILQVGAAHVAHSFTQAGANPLLTVGGTITTGRLRFENAVYTTYDASFGFSKDAWTVSLVGENLSNSHASTFTGTDQFIVAETPLRPRVLGVSLGYKF